MTRVDFYTLKDDHLDARYELVYKLLEKSLKQGHQVHIHCRDKAEATTLDDYLWSYKLTAFIPHHQLGETSSTMQSPVTLGFADHVPTHNDIGINLSHQPMAGFNRIIEIVIQETQILNQTRQHYRHYQQQQCDLHLHQL